MTGQICQDGLRCHCPNRRLLEILEVPRDDHLRLAGDRSSYLHRVFKVTHVEMAGIDQALCGRRSDFNEPREV